MKRAHTTRVRAKVRRYIQASCSCGWKGEERTTRGLANVDAAEHRDICWRGGEEVKAG